MRLTAAAKRGFTPEDVYARGRQTLERAIGWGTTRIRTHVEVDPGIGMRGFEGVQQLARDYAWAAEIELCVFPQEGLLNNPGTEALLEEGLRRGARVIGAAPYTDTDPRGQIDRIFALARAYEVDVDMHLDMGETADGMQAEYVCRKTEEHGWGGRVTVGHVSQASLLPPARFAALAATLARAGVAVTVLAGDGPVPHRPLPRPRRAAGCAARAHAAGGRRGLLGGHQQRAEPVHPLWRRQPAADGQPVGQRLPGSPARPSWPAAWRW